MGLEEGVGGWIFPVFMLQHQSLFDSLMRLKHGNNSFALVKGIEIYELLFCFDVDNRDMGNNQRGR